MTTAVAVKTYTFPARNLLFSATGTVLTDNRNFVYGVKNVLNTMGVPWQVRGSSNAASASLLAVGAAGPGTDLWTSGSALTWANAGVARSWVVLRNDKVVQDAPGVHFELLISCEAAQVSGQTLAAWVSPGAGFTGGSTTARPTATDEIVLRASSSTTDFGGVSGASANLRLNAIQSTDGEVTHLWAYASGVPIMWLRLERPQNPVSGWSNPSASVWLGSNTTTLANVASVANLYSTASVQGRGTSTMSLFCTAEAANGATVFAAANQANDLSGAVPLGDVGYFSTTAGNRGRHGKATDMYWSVAAVAEADSDVGGGATRLWDKVGALWLPSNNVVLVTS